MYHGLASYTNRPNDCVPAASSILAPAGQASRASNIRKQHVQPAAAIAGAAVLH